MKIPSGLRKQMRKMGEKAYPNEGCGILLGSFGSEVEVTEVRDGTNLKVDETDDEGHARGRYILDPKEIFQAKLDAQKQGVEIVGFWHTHPDWLARPSQYDADHSWSKYVYMIMAVHRGRQKKVRAFVLAQEEPPVFRRESIRN